MQPAQDVGAMASAVTVKTRPSVSVASVTWIEAPFF